MRVRLMALIAIVVVALAGQALAQETTGAVNGRVTIRRASPCQGRPSR